MNVQIVCDDATHPRHQVTIATVHARRQVFASDSPDPHEPGYYGELQWWARLDGMTVDTVASDGTVLSSTGIHRLLLGYQDGRPIDEDDTHKTITLRCPLCGRERRVRRDRLLSISRNAEELGAAKLPLARL